MNKILKLKQLKAKQELLLNPKKLKFESMHWQLFGTIFSATDLGILTDKNRREIDC